MSLKFNEALHILVKDLPKPPKPEHILYIQDAAEISEKINLELIKMNSIFKGTVSNWEATSTYMLKDIYKIWIPFLWLKIPFKVQPQRRHSAPCSAYKLKTSVNHPAVENGFVNGLKLTKLFYQDIVKTIVRLGKFTCKSGKTYRLYSKFTELDGKQFFQIFVKENEYQEEPLILYQFNLIFTLPEESLNYSYCCDFFRPFEKSISEASSRRISEMVYKINILLFKLLLDSSLTVEKIHNILTDTIFRKKEERFEEVLLDVMIKFSPFVKNTAPLAKACAKLWEFKQADSVKVSELKEVFGIQ